MRYVVFFAPKGGVGSTTMAAHFAWNAARSGVRTGAVSLDPTGSLVHLLAGSDLCLERDAIWPVEPNLWTTFSPEEMPPPAVWETEPELVVVDVKHGGPGTVAPRVDLWVLPVGDEQALRNLVGGRFPPIEAERHQLVVNLLAPCNDPRRLAREVAEAEEIELYPEGIPAAASIRQAVDASQCVWEGRFHGSYTSRTFRKWANATLQSVMPQSL